MKNRKYKLVKSLPSPDEQIINELNDFDQVKEMASKANPTDYPIKSNGLNFKFLSIFIGSALIITVFIFWIMANKAKQISFIEEVNYKVEPSSLLAKKFEEFNYVSGEADTFFTEKGSVIILPACKLQNDAKNEVEGKVTLRFRQFNNAAELALSGITLNYDSAGNKYLFESNGMFEIDANQNGNYLHIPADCPCKVLLATNSFEPKFNNYFLDTATANWVYLGPMVKEKFDNFGAIEKEKMPMNQSNLTEFVEEKMTPEINQLPKLPQLPKQDDEELPNFRINAKENEFPELAVYKGILFEVEPKDAIRSVPIFGMVWSNIDLITVKSGELYKVKMQKFNKSNKLVNSDSILVHPIIDQENYEGELKKYKELEKKHRLALKKQNEEFESRKALARLQTEKAVKESRSRNMEQIKSNNDLSYPSFRSAFSVVNFGIYNSDNPMANQNPKLDVTVHLGNKLDPKKALSKGHLFHVIPMYNTFTTNYLFGVTNETLKFTAQPFFMDGEKFFIVINEHSIAVWNSQYLLENKRSSSLALDLKYAKIYKNLKNEDEAVKVLLGSK
jgi:hypothetical protein